MNLKTVALLGRSVRSNSCQVSRRSLLGAFGVSVDTGLGSSRRAVPSLQIPAHKEALRDLSCAPSGGKFVSCADDSHAKIWDLRTLREERTFTGHRRPEGTAGTSRRLRQRTDFRSSEEVTSSYSSTSS